MAHCATPTARAAVWMRALSKVAINCLKPCALGAAEQILGLHLETVEAQLVFLHAAIAEHADLAAAHAGGREGIGVGAARLLGEEHREAAIVRRVGIGRAPARSSRPCALAWVIQVLLPVTW